MIDILKDLKRTNYCGELRNDDVGNKVVLMGWVQKIRDLGDLVFIDLRDRTGLIQVVFSIDKDLKLHTEAKSIRNEFVIAIVGVVNLRPENIINKDIETGSIEVYVKKMIVLNSANSSPFPIANDVNIFEAFRMEHRYLDLKRPKMQKLILFRHKIATSVRNYLNVNGFVDIETPFLTNSTPEGARDYLVPSRLNPGKFYALPQSPQLFKQLLMISGFDKYYQIVRCFRDEDLRADRQPEFTQIDIEMSFVDIEDIISLSEKMIKNVLKDVFDIDCTIPFKRLSYWDSIDKYGLDKPNIGFDLELVNISDVVKNSKFNLFSRIIKEGGVVKGLNIKNNFEVSRGLIDKFEKFVKRYNAKGLIWAKVDANKWKSPIDKFLSDYEKLAINKKLNGETGDLFLLLAGDYEMVSEAFGNLRNYIANKLNLIDNKKFNFLWVVDFPMFKYDRITKSYQAYHHPFTSPIEGEFERFNKTPEKIRSKAYDLVLNGYEIGGGSIRIHKEDLQKKIFKILQMNSKEMNNKFGYLLKALSFGAPPHGGIAFGFDRLVMLLCGEKSIKNVIPFPKSLSGGCLLTGAPSKVSDEQLKELFLKLK